MFTHSCCVCRCLFIFPWINAAAEARSIDAGISIQTEVACAPITGTEQVTSLGHAAFNLLLSLFAVLSLCWCDFMVFWLWISGWLDALWILSASCYSASFCIWIVVVNYFYCISLSWLSLCKPLPSCSFLSFCPTHLSPVFLFYSAPTRDEREEHPVSDGPTHPGALQCDEHGRLGGHHLPLFISLLLAAFRDGGPHAWGAPPITLHPGQKLRGQQQRPDPQRWSCQVPGVPQTVIRWAQIHWDRLWVGRVI